MAIQPDTLCGRLCGASPFFKQYYTRVAGALPDYNAAFDAQHFVVPPNEDALRYFRKLRAPLLAHLLWREANGQASLQEVFTAMSDFADNAVRAVIQQAFADMSARHLRLYGKTPLPPECLDDFVVVAMGKWGGDELNVSSDIDVIFLYTGEDVQERSQEKSRYEIFHKLARQVVQGLSEVSEDGWIFRVDTDLRPNGKAGPLLCSFDSLQNYFYTQGREWERYAWLKARFITGSVAVQNALHAIVKPFVYRRYCDYSVIDHLRTMQQQISAEAQRMAQQSARYGDSVKLGQGGIRHIEFFTQVFQLIRGGRDIDLQLRSTRCALEILARKAYISADSAKTLRSAYDFLRRVEHALQWREDAQTHYLPTDEAAQAAVVAILGYDSYQHLLSELSQQRAIVSQHFNHIFANSLLAEAQEEVVQNLPTRWDDLLQNKRVLKAPEKSQDKLRSLCMATEKLLEQHPPEAHTQMMYWFVTLMESVIRRPIYIDLLREYPLVLEKLLSLFRHSAWAAQYLCQHPVLLDDLAIKNTVATADFIEDVEAGIAQRHGDIEEQLVFLRERHRSQVFACLLEDLAGNMTVEQVSDELSRLADAVLVVVMSLAWSLLRERHREQPRVAVLAFGKLGSKELAYGSDLDVVFVYDDDADAAPVAYAKWAQKFCSLLTMPTTAGSLFEVDTALRPDGGVGLSAVSRSAFEKYYHERAWMWEHQALTRARVCAGDKDLAEKLETFRIATVELVRPLDALQKELAAMRQRMQQAHPSTPAGVFDIKQDRGGMIDIEFMVQFWVLGYSHQYPELTANHGNIALLAYVAARGLITPETASLVADTYRALRRVAHLRHLQNITHSQVAEAEVAAYRNGIAAVVELWQVVIGS